MDWPSDAIGKLNKDKDRFEFNEEMLSFLKVTECDIRKHMKTIN